MCDEKQALRAQLLAKRSQITPQQLNELSQCIGKQVLHWVRAQGIQTVFCYVSYGQEVETHHLLTELEARGCAVYVPRVTGPGEMQAVRWSHKSELRPNRWGIPEPVTGAVLQGGVDAALIPGVAFGRDGSRMGYGGGFYDRWLAAHPCLRMGLCAGQLLQDRLPVEAHDLPMDGIFSETGQITFTRRDISTKIIRSAED